MSPDRPLFAHGDLNSYLRQRAQGIQAEIDTMPKDQFLASSEETIIDHLLSEHQIEPLVLFKERMQMEHGETTIEGRTIDGSVRRLRPANVPGIAILISIPYTGTYPLWDMQPNRRRGNFPEGKVQPVPVHGFGLLEIALEAPLDADAGRIKEVVEQRLSDIQFYLEAQREQIEADNSTLLDRIRQAVQARRGRIEKQEGLARSLNIPLKTRKGTPEFAPLPIKRTLQKPLPPPPKEGFKPEPGIRDEDYEHILRVIRHAGCSFECTPETLAVHDEEGLRNLILANLNGHYEGDATGETFRRKGKTDIRIEVQDRAAFVGECKIWGGKKEMQGACDQLLSYLTWRDCKAALIIFNRHVKEFSEVMKRLSEAITDHPLFVRELPRGRPGEWRYMLRSKEDPNRLITLHVFAFNLVVS